jgi:regulatory protein
MSGLITAIKAQKKDKTRLSVYVDRVYAFSLDRSLVIALKVGQHLSEGEIEQLSSKDEEQRAYRRTLRWLSRRPHAEQEIREKLARSGVPEAVQDRTLERLKATEMVDDGAFARAWVENRAAFRPRSAHALSRELALKGVSKELIGLALQDYDAAAAARKAAHAGWRRYRHLPAEIARRRLSGYLERRGFSYAEIKDAIQEIDSVERLSEIESEVRT